MATNNSWNNAIAAANSAITLNSGTNTISVSTDASATTVNLGTGGAVKAVTLGSTNSTSATTVQSGSGALNVTATGGALTINSGTGNLSISSDASATTIAVGTGGAVKGVTVGSTNSSSSLALKCGTGNFSLASATGTLMSADAGGPINYPLLPCVNAYNNADATNVTGDGTIYTVQFNTKLTDQHNDFSSNTTFTAPVTGVYSFTSVLTFSGLTSSNTYAQAWFNLTGKTSFFMTLNGGTTNIAGVVQIGGTISVPMTAADTCTIQAAVYGSTKTVTIAGGNSSSYQPVFNARLVC